MMNDINSPLDPFVYNNPYFPTDLSRSQYYYQTGGGVEEQVQQIIMQYAELAGTSPEQIVEGLKGLSEEQVQEQLALMAEEIEEAQRQEEMLRRARQQEDEDVSVEGEEESSMFDVYDPEEFEERQNMIMANVQADNNQQMVEEEEEEPVQQEKTEAQSYREDRYKYGGAKKKFLSKLKKAMNGMAADTLPKVSFDKDDYGQNMLGSFVQGVQKNSQRALEAEAAEKVQETLSQNPQMMMPVMAQYGMQMYNPAATLSENAMGGMDYLRSIAPTNQDIQNSFGNMAGAFANDFLPQQQRGGTLPIFQNTGENNLKQQGRDYFRKIWERTQGVGIPQAQKQQLFDAWYAGQKVEDWKDILPQAPGGNYFNQALTNQMFNNPWGYRAYNNPYLQQFAYAPRYKASVDGKKININNLQDWSNANLIQTEQMTNRRGRVTGTRYKLQKPSSVIRTEQPVIDPNYSVPKVDDVMLNSPSPASQPAVVPTTRNTEKTGYVTDLVQKAYSNPNVFSLNNPEWQNNVRSTSKFYDESDTPGSILLPGQIGPLNEGQLQMEDLVGKSRYPQVIDLNRDSKLDDITFDTSKYPDQETALNQFRKDWLDNYLSERGRGAAYIRPELGNKGYIAPWEIGPYTKEQDEIEKDAYDTTSVRYKTPSGKGTEYGLDRDLDMRDFYTKRFTQFREDFNKLPVEKNNEDDPLEISDDKRKEFDKTIKNAPQGTTIEIVPNQYGGPQMIPYDQNYIDQQYGLYNNFYKNYYAPPADGALKRDDGYDAYMYDLREKEKPSRDEIGRLGRMVQSFNVYKRRKNSFPSNTYPGILKSKQTGGQLYLYRNGGLPRFQGPDISQVLAKPEIDPNLVYNTQQYNKEYDLPQETLDITETYKPNFLQGVARGIPYMNFANNIYDRIFAENQRAKIRERATSIESTATPFADYKGRFSEYGAYQPNLQGFQGMGSAQYGGMIGDGEYYLSDSEIQDIINMGGEVEFLED